MFVVCVRVWERDREERQRHRENKEGRSKIKGEPGKTKREILMSVIKREKKRVRKKES